MSLYTPVFPSFHELNSTRKDLPDNTLGAAVSKQQSYAEFLRDVHLFLSTQNDVLSPPSRPSTPLFDHRVQKVRDEIQDVFNAREDETSSAKWTRLSQTLKLGCVRGRPWSVSKADPTASKEDTNWILPDEESEWIEWEKQREEGRRLKGKTNVSPQIDRPASAIPDTRKPNRATLSQPDAIARERFPRGVSPATLRAAKEKVARWQASVASELSHDTTSSSSLPSTGVVAVTTPAQGKAERPKRSHTLDFAVVKPAAKSIIAKRGKRPLSRPAVRSSPALTPSHKSKSPEPSKAFHVPRITTPVGANKPGSEQPLKTSPVKNERPRIVDVPETPYLPPSFPAHLETSTPLADSVILVRAKPSPILPIPDSLSMLLPSAPANPPEDRQLLPPPHAANMLFSLPPQINTVHPGKRSRGFSTSLDDIPDDPLLTPPAKRLRTSLQNSNPASQHSKPMSPNGGLDPLSGTRDDARNPSLGAAPSHRYNMDSLEMVPGAPLAHGRNEQLVTGADAQGFPEKAPSPTKSVKSYFSAPDSDPADSPMKANLLLESPVSPMLAYAQNPSGFLPQITSTQIRKGSPTPARTNGQSGIFGMGYSSQFDVERRVDRVSELLERDVDFDGWLRDTRTVETSQDQ